MIDGRVIRKARKELHLSQSDLAKNITTQATISKLENDSVAPNGDIMTQITHRLKLSMSDVVFTELLNPDRVLKQADQLASAFDYQGVIDKLKEIDIKTLVMHDDKMHYDFLKTNSTMWLSKDFDRAIFNFNKMLDSVTDRNRVASIYGALAICQLGVAYFSKNEIDSANYYFEQVPDLIAQFSPNQNVYSILFALDNVTNFWSKTGKYKKSNSLGEKALAIASANKTVLFTDEISFTMGENYGELNGWDDDVTKHYILESWGLATLIQNQVALKIIEDGIQEHQMVFSYQQIHQL